MGGKDALLIERLGLFQDRNPTFLVDRVCTFPAQSTHSRLKERAVERTHELCQSETLKPVSLPSDASANASRVLLGNVKGSLRATITLHSCALNILDVMSAVKGA